MDRQVSDKQNLQNRWRSVQGHMRAIDQMIVNDAPCTEILHQLLAVRGAMGAVQLELWRAHLLDRDCRLRSKARVQRLRAWRELQEILSGESIP